MSPPDEGSSSPLVAGAGGGMGACGRSGAEVWGVGAAVDGQGGVSCVGSCWSWTGDAREVVGLGGDEAMGGVGWFWRGSTEDGRDEGEELGCS